MASPRIFVSSTFYDLKYIRENLKYFIRTIGYEPTLSEEGDVYYNPKKHTHDSCISEVSSCQIFVLIIGGRFGGQFKGNEKSITNNEYLEAVKNKIPVFALVEASVYAEHHVYNENLKLNGAKTAGSIKYPSVDNIKIFEFIEDVKKNAINNALVPFRDFTDIEIYLKKQWAGMMYNFLSDTIEENKVSDTLSALTIVSDKIELLSKQILNSVGSAKALLTIKLYEIMISYECFRDLGFMGLKPTPQDIIRNSDFISLAKSYGVKIKKYPENSEKEGSYTLSGDGTMSKLRLERDSKQYLELREQFLGLLSEKGISENEYLTE